jgi:hypothetical protein
MSEFGIPITLSLAGIVAYEQFLIEGFIILFVPVAIL